MIELAIEQLRSKLGKIFSHYPKVKEKEIENAGKAFLPYLIQIADFSIKFASKNFLRKNIRETNF